MADGKEAESTEEAGASNKCVCVWGGLILTLGVSHIYECTRQHLHNETSGCTLHPKCVCRKCIPMSQDRR